MLRAWKRKEGQAECRAFWKSPDHAGTRLAGDNPGIAWHCRGLSRQPSVLPSLSSRYCKVSLLLKLTSLWCHPLPACSCPTQHHLATGILLWLTLRTWDGPLSQMHTTLHLTLTSSTSQPRHSATCPQHQQFLPPSSAFCILFPGLENRILSPYIPSDLYSPFIIKPSTEHSEYSGNHPWIFTGRTDAQAEAPILWPLIAKNWFTGKDLDAGKDRRQEEKGTTEDEMVGWHHRLNGHESEQALGDGEGQGSLACCSPWRHKESNTTERLNNRVLLVTRLLPLCTALSFLCNVLQHFLRGETYPLNTPPH